SVTSVSFTCSAALRALHSFPTRRSSDLGHGASPNSTIDPIVMAAQLIVSLQTLVSRELDPVTLGVVTVGSIHAGTKHNVIPDDCKLQITVRSYGDDVRQTLLEGIRRKAEAVAQGGGAKTATVMIRDDGAP